MKLIYGVGINDADYVTQVMKTIGYSEDGKQIREKAWTCPFFHRWKNMLQRCYSEKFLMANSSYRGCYTVPEWHYFMTFRAWMEKQDWEGNHLDKDLLFSGNRLYGPKTCIFVSRAVNNFLTERQSRRGEWPIGVNFHKETGKFRAQGYDTLTGKRKSLGYFHTPKEAYEAWLNFKRDQAKLLSEQQKDFRIAKALIERYINY